MVGIDLLQNHDVKAHQLTKPAPGQPPAGWASLLTDLSQRARKPIESSLLQISDLPSHEARALRPLILLGQQSLALLDVIEAAHDDVLHQRLLLTPWRKAWLAQRVAWGFLR